MEGIHVKFTVKDSSLHLVSLSLFPRPRRPPDAVGVRVSNNSSVRNVTWAPGSFAYSPVRDILPFFFLFFFFLFILFGEMESESFFCGLACPPPLSLLFGPVYVLQGWTLG